MIKCERCDGTGRDKYGLCWTCYGAGELPSVEEQRQRIAELIVSHRGRTKGQLRKSRPPRADHRQHSPAENVARCRAYYVWRLARFHGGADVCMPIGADMECYGDPELDKLDQIAMAVARAAFGTDMAATARWGTAMGWLQDDQVPIGLPASAYRGGPSFDANKPIDELLETL